MARDCFLGPTACSLSSRGQSGLTQGTCCHHCHGRRTDRDGPRSHFLNSQTFGNRSLTPTPKGEASSSKSPWLPGRTACWSQNQDSKWGRALCVLRATARTRPGAPPGLLCPAEAAPVLTRGRLPNAPPRPLLTRPQTCFSWGLSGLAAPLRSRLQAALPPVQSWVTWQRAAFPGALNRPPFRLAAPCGRPAPPGGLSSSRRPLPPTAGHSHLQRRQWPPAAGPPSDSALESTAHCGVPTGAREAEVPQSSGSPRPLVSSPGIGAGGGVTCHRGPALPPFLSLLPTSVPQALRCPQPRY